MHRRFAPKAHGFRHRIFLFALDLDELDALDQRLRLFSVGRASLYSFRDGDYLPTDDARWNATSRRVSAEPGRAGVPPAPAEPSAPGTSCSTSDAPDPKSKFNNLKSRVVSYLATHGVDLAGGRVELVTLPRVAGYLFNPVSFYFCYDRAGACVAAVPEVTNTFREMKPFFLGPSDRSQMSDARDQNWATDPRPTATAAPEFSIPPPVSFRKRVPKHFYVSPFSDVDVAFDFILRPPGDRLLIQIDDYVGTTRTLTSTLTGRARPLTDAALLAVTLRHPLQPLHTIALIHWHAFRLWLRRVPWFAKAARASDQRDVLRPHLTLTRPAGPALPHPSDAA